MPRSLVIQYPDNLPDLLQITTEDFEKQARLALAVKLFEMKRISSGVAAKLADVDRVTFLFRLKDFGVSMIDLDQEELKQDLENV